MSSVHQWSKQTKVQSQVVSYQRLKKWYLMPPCLTLSIIRYRSRVKWSNPGKGVVPSPKSQCSSYWKGSLVSLKGDNFTFIDLCCKIWFQEVFFYFLLNPHTQLVLMALFLAAKRDSVSLMRLHFFSYVQVILCAIFVVCHSKYSYSCCCCCCYLLL